MVTFRAGKDCEIDFAAGILRTPNHEGTLDYFRGTAPGAGGVSTGDEGYAAGVARVSVPGFEVTDPSESCCGEAEAVAGSYLFPSCA